MKVRKIMLQVLFFIFALISIAGCSGDDKKNDYSTVSNMIADRNQARLNKANQESSSKKTIENKSPLPEETSDNQTSKQSYPGMTFEEDISIVSDSSGKTIGVGKAYLDKSGKIINIRIKNR